MTHVATSNDSVIQSDLHYSSFLKLTKFIKDV